MANTNIVKLAINVANVKNFVTASRQFLGQHAKNLAQNPTLQKTVQWAGSSVPWQTHNSQNIWLNRAKQVGNFARQKIIGNPIDLANNIKAQGISGVYKNHFLPKIKPTEYTGTNTLEKMWHRVSPTLQRISPFVEPTMAMASAIRNPENRGSNIGAALGGIAVSPISSQLGMPGAFLTNSAARIGRSVGQQFDRPQTNEIQQMPYTMYRR
jgi:hypothetical protein